MNSRNRTRELFVCAAAAMMTAVFCLFSFNSGYGYDALEYLVIGRSLIDGHSLYDFIPSKSWGIYVFTAGLLRLGTPQTHAGVTAIVTLLFAAVVGGTWTAATRLWTSKEGTAAPLLVGLCAAFMELNYLEPEPFVYLSGLAALYTIARHSNLSRSLPWLCAGVWISLGCVFKMVAAFYLGGLYLFLIVCLLRSQLTLRQGLRCASWSTLGFALVFVPQILYFHLSGRLHSFIEWTLIYPAFHTPGNTVFLSKLFTKLIWFPMLLIGAVCLSWSPKVRNPILGDHTAVLALCLGLVSFGSLCKSQASHYYFPGAAMCCLFITRVFVLYGRTAFQRLSTRWFAVTTAALAAAIGVSVYTYNPSATARLFTLRSFDAEQRFGAAVDRLTGPATFIAFRNPVLLYWITRKYPVVPIVNTEHQSTAWLETHGQELIAALDNPKLTLVEFDPVSPSIDDFRKLTPAHMRPLLHMFALKLRQGFDPLRPGNDYVFWVRKSMDSSGSAVHLPTRM